MHLRSAGRGSRRFLDLLPLTVDALYRHCRNPSLDGGGNWPGIADSHREHVAVWKIDLHRR